MSLPQKLRFLAKIFVFLTWNRTESGLTNLPPSSHIYQGVKRVKNDPRSLNRVSEHVEIKDSSLKYRKNKNISKKQTYVEHGASARYSRVATLRMLVDSPWSKDLDNHWTDFCDFLHEVIRQEVKKSNRAGFLKKVSIIEIWGIKWPKWVKNGVFWIFLKNDPNVFFHVLCGVRDWYCANFGENRMLS